MSAAEEEEFQNFTKQRYDVNLLLLSIVVAYFGSYMTTCLSEQLRITCLHYKNNKGGWLKLFWVLLIGTSLGGISMWAMHFISLAAVELVNLETGNIVRVDYNIAISIITLILICCTASLGVYISSHDIMFAKTKLEILDMFLVDSRALSMAQVRKMKNWMIIRVMTTKSLWRLVLGGAIIGSGVVIMHYVGMRCMEFEGHFQWFWGEVAASVLIALIAGIISFWIIFRVLSVFPGREWLRQAGAITMASAVLGTHYTGMAAMRIDYDGQERPQFIRSGIFHQEKIGDALFVAVTFMIWVYMVVVFADLRHIASRYRQYLKRTHQFEQLNYSVASTHSSDSGGNNSRVISRLVASNKSRVAIDENSKLELNESICNSNKNNSNNNQLSEANLDAMEFSSPQQFE